MRLSKNLIFLILQSTEEENLKWNVLALKLGMRAK
jgi:hypothetical protein